MDLSKEEIERLISVLDCVDSEFGGTHARNASVETAEDWRLHDDLHSRLEIELSRLRRAFCGAVYLSDVTCTLESGHEEEGEELHQAPNPFKEGQFIKWPDFLNEGHDHVS